MSNEIIIAENTENGNNVAGIYSSITAQTQEEKLQIYAAVQNSEPLADHIGEVINIENVVIQAVEVENPRTGETEPASRIVCVTDKGDTYGCTSSGVATSMKNLFAIVGNPPWSPALPMKIVQKQGRNGYKFTSLEWEPKSKK